MALTVVLSAGLDPELLGTRNLVLQSAGYLVVSAYSIKEAVIRFQGGDFDLVLLCESIPAKEKDRLTSLIRASGARIPVVSVSPKSGSNETVTGVTVGSDPGALLWGIREVLINAEESLARMAMPPLSQEGPAAPGRKLPRTAREQRTAFPHPRLVPLGRAG